MKLYTIFFFVSIALFSCSKPSTEPAPDSEPEIVVPDTSLAGQLNLKITDKENLILVKKLFEDSKGNYIIAGEKSEKHWIGCFDKTGNEIMVKTYTDDPTSIVIPNGSPEGISASISYNNYQQITEINGIIYIVRQICLDSNKNNRGYFAEDLTRINPIAKTINNDYTIIQMGIPFINQVTEWYGSYYRIARDIHINYLKSRPFLTTIYDVSDNKIGEFETLSGENSIAGYLAVSDNTYTLIRRGGFLQCWNYQNTRLIYERRIFNLENGNYVVDIDSFKLVDNIIEIQYTYTASNGDKETKLVKLDPATGDML